MSGEIINGQLLAKELRDGMKDKVNELKERGITPHLTVILIGDDPASHSYVNGKKKASHEVGISSDIIKMDSTIKEEELLEEINSLNNDPRVHGILVQLPIPDHIDEQKVIET